MSDWKTSKETQAEIDALTEQSAATLRLEMADLTRQAEEGKSKCQALLRKMVGHRITVAKKDDPLHGMEAVITGPPGKSKKPMCWWFRTTTGIKARKAETSFKLLSLDSPSKSKQSVIDLGKHQSSILANRTRMSKPAFKSHRVACGNHSMCLPRPQLHARRLRIDPMTDDRFKSMIDMLVHSIPFEHAN